MVSGQAINSWIAAAADVAQGFATLLLIAFVIGAASWLYERHEAQRRRDAERRWRIAQSRARIVHVREVES